MTRGSGLSRLGAALAAMAMPACISVKIDTTDSITTFVSLTDILTDSITDTLPTGPSTDPTGDPTGDPTTVDPTTGDPTGDPTTITTITTDPTIDPSTTTIGPQPICGDGIAEPPEECDDGNASQTDACLSNCSAASCGDGFVRAGVEVCDDGINDDSYNGCAPGCAELGPHCGDGAVQGVEGEQCDDGNEVAGDGCTLCQPDVQQDECNDAIELSEASRNVASGSDDVECDLALPEAGLWARFTGAAGTRMPTVAPAKFSCGTHAPGWLNGQEPTVEEGIVDREVCFHWESEPCHFSAAIKVKNCGAFLVYRLPKVPSCALRYCGAN